MSLVSSNPQRQAVELLIKTFRPKLAPYVGLKPDMDRAEQAVTGKGCILTLGEIVDCLAEAGLLVTPQASSAERSEESLVSAIAESLRDFRFEVGPNTLEMLKVGQAAYLTPEERRQIAHAAVLAYRQVTADE